MPLAKIRHMYPGGNTRYAFFSLYDHLAGPQAKRKIVLKGGPGTGKSTFMKNVGNFFYERGLDIEYHWCSSDNESLDGVVIPDQQICLLDGTAPHIVDPAFPGAVDEIINLGQFWEREKIAWSRDAIIELSEIISRCFSLAYLRLQECGAAYEELKFYHHHSLDQPAVNRNILALTADFLEEPSPSQRQPRHLFAAAITPEGFKSRVESLIPEDAVLFGVKGSPGSGIKELFKNIEEQVTLRGIYAEIFHNPFDPAELDLIILPESKRVLLDISTNLPYEKRLPMQKYRRLLDFDNLLLRSHLDIHAKHIAAGSDRMEAGFKAAIDFIARAKKAHDELESYYIPAMDFDSINHLRAELQEELRQELEI